MARSQRQRESWVTIREAPRYLLTCGACGWTGESTRIEKAMRRAEQHECP